MKKLFKFLTVVLIASSLLVGCTTKQETAATVQPSEDTEVVIYIVRHGKTMLNTTDRAQGWSDAVLTPPGVEVVEYLGLGLKDVKFAAAYSSDSGRSIQTAKIILDKSGQSDLSLVTSSDFREFGFGSYEGDYNHTMLGDVAERNGTTLENFATAGLSLKDVANTIAELDKERTADQEPGINWPAEDYATIEARLKTGLDRIATEAMNNGGGNILLVSHGMSINAMVLMIDPSAEVPPTGPKNASVTKITYKDGKYTVESVNDLSYVENGKTQK